MINRVGHYAELSEDSFDSLSQLPHRIETRRPGEEIVATGDMFDFVFVVESGWAIRYRILDDGRRQIVNFMLPGACFDMMPMAYGSGLLRKMTTQFAITQYFGAVIRRCGDRRL